MSCDYVWAMEPVSLFKFRLSLITYESYFIFLRLNFPHSHNAVNIGHDLVELLCLTQSKFSVNINYCYGLQAFHLSDGETDLEAWTNTAELGLQLFSDFHSPKMAAEDCQDKSFPLRKINPAFTGENCLIYKLTWSVSNFEASGNLR